jgi:histidinol-phosphate phosphatase family protein
LSLRPAVFLDRDGVVNVFPGPGKFVTSWEMFQFMPGVDEQLRRLRAHGFFLALITNQSGVGRGLMELDDLHEIHDNMQKELGEHAIDAIYFCHHHPDDGCDCRKPSPAMIRRACADHQLDPAQSVMIGDSGRDIEMGRAAGCKTILCREKLPPNAEALKPEHRPDQMFKTLGEAVDWTLENIHHEDTKTQRHKGEQIKKS